MRSPAVPTASRSWHFAAQLGRSISRTGAAHDGRDRRSGLRAGSERDAHAVVAAARALGLEAHILTGTGRTRPAAIQATARDARGTICSGHMRRRAGRLVRNPHCAHAGRSGGDRSDGGSREVADPTGLRYARRAPTQRVRRRIPRPTVLRYTRAQMRSFLTANGVRWIDDPSNEDQRFERVRLRAAAEGAASLWFDTTDAGTRRRAQRRPCRRSRRRPMRSPHLHSTFTAVFCFDRSTAVSRRPARVANSPARAGAAHVRRRIATGGIGSNRASRAGLGGKSSTQVTLGGCAVRACDRQFASFERQAVPSCRVPNCPPVKAWFGTGGSISEQVASGRAKWRGRGAGAGSSSSRGVRQKVDLPSRAAATRRRCGRGTRSSRLGVSHRVFTDEGHPAARAVEHGFSSHPQNRRAVIIFTKEAIGSASLP